MTSDRRVLRVLRVLQVVSSRERRGAEVFAHQLGTELSRRGHAVETLALSEGSSTDPLPFRALGRDRTDPRMIKELAAAMRAHDVAVSHGGTTLAPVALAARLARRPFAYRNIGDPAHWGRARGAAVRVGLPLRSASTVVTLYPGARDYLLARYSLRPDRVVVASNAVDGREFPRRGPRDRDAARARLGSDATGPTIGYLGSLSAEKRPEWVLELARRTQGASILVGGDGPMRAALESAAHDEGLTDRRVRFLGTVTDPAAFLRALDVLVIPSRTEGIPGVLLEAALTGVPVVGTDVGGMGAVVSNLRCGTVVAADDLDGFVAAVDHLLASPGEAVADRDRVLAHHGIEQVASTWEAALARAA